MSGLTPLTVTDAAALETHGRWRYGAALAACVVTAVMCYPLIGRVDLANIIMVFLLIVVLTARYGGRGPAVLAAFASVAIFDLVFVPPQWTLAVSDVQYLLTLAVMLAAALITASLTAGLKQQLRMTARRERETRALYASARELAGAISAAQTAESIARATASLFHADSVLLLPDADDQLCDALAGTDNAKTRIAKGIPQWIERQTAEAVYRNAAIGDNSDLGGLSGAEPAVHYRALRAPMRVRGVLVVRGAIARDQCALLDALASLSAIAVERLHYVDVAQRTQMQMNAERLRHSLLAAVSHDLRTPLTALVGLADTLALPSAALNPTALGTAETIRDQARQLAVLVDNLLDMARLQTGHVTLRREWQPIDEVIGSSLQLQRYRLRNYPVKVDIAAELPLVDIDAVLIERVLCNLLDNAAKYSADGSPIGIEARLRDGQLLVAISDNGRGVAATDRTRIFEVFERGETEPAAIGAGLGLSIARSVVEAHGGRLDTVPQAHGARFEFTIPIGNPPPIEIENDTAASDGSRP